MTEQLGLPSIEIRKLGGSEHLNDADIERFGKACCRIKAAMHPESGRIGRWFTAPEIIAIAGQREGLRRMRELRTWPGVYEIETKRVGNDFEYRMILDEAE